MVAVPQGDPAEQHEASGDVVALFKREVNKVGDQLPTAPHYPPYLLEKTMDTETKVATFFMIFLFLILGSLLIEGQLKRLDRQACVIAMKDRPASEILAVCK